MRQSSLFHWHPGSGKYLSYAFKVFSKLNSDVFSLFSQEKKKNTQLRNKQLHCSQKIWLQKCNSPQFHFSPNLLCFLSALFEVKTVNCEVKSLPALPSGLAVWAELQRGSQVSRQPGSVHLLRTRASDSCEHFLSLHFQIFSLLSLPLSPDFFQTEDVFVGNR